MRRTLLGVVLILATALLAPAATPAQAAPYQVLVFSKTAGFRHDSIAAGLTAIQQLGAANNFTVVATEDAAAFNDTNLANFATVVWLHTTGDVLDATSRPPSNAISAMGAASPGFTPLPTPNMAGLGTATWSGRTSRATRPSSR